MRKKIEYAGTVDGNQPFEVSLSYCFWPLVASDQWFLPRFKLKIKNLGKTLYKGSVAIDITEFSNIEKISQISSYKGHFQDIFRHEITELLPGKEDSVTFTIQSRFLSPDEYILRAVLNEWIPSDSPIRELQKQLDETGTDPKKKELMIQQSEQHMKQMGMDPYAVPRGQFNAKQIFDLRFIEKIKIHSLASTATIMGGFIGSVIAASGTFLYATIKIIKDNWASISALF